MISTEQVWLIVLLIGVGGPILMRVAGLRLMSCLNFAFTIFGAAMLVYWVGPAYFSKFGVYVVIMLAVMVWLLLEPD